MTEPLAKTVTMNRSVERVFGMIACFPAAEKRREHAPEILRLCSGVPTSSVGINMRE